MRGGGTLKIAIPRFQERVAPCFEYSATIAIFTVEDGRVIDQQDFSLQSRLTLDRVRLLRDQEVDVLICGGMQDSFEDLVKARGIEVISWVKGEVETILRRYLRGQLTSDDNHRGRDPGPTGYTSEEDSPACRTRASKPKASR